MPQKAEKSVGTKRFELRLGRFSGLRLTKGGGALRLSRLFIVGFKNEGVAASGPCDEDSPTPVPQVLVEERLMA